VVFTVNRFVRCENITCLKRFTRYGYYTGEVEGTIVARLPILFFYIAVPKIKTRF